MSEQTPAAARLAETQEKAREAILAALRRGASYTAAAQAGGVGRATLYRWMEEDDVFKTACSDAYESGTDAMEDESRRRGVEGVEKPIFYKGAQVATVREYSDTMLAMQLNARRPEKYRTNHKVEHSGGVKITISPDDADL